MMRKLICIVFCVSLCCSSLADAQAPAERLHGKDPVMVRHAEGTFEVKTTPLPAEEGAGGPAIGRFALLKQYHGDLEAASKGEMLAAGDLAKGTAGYVAIEQVVGTLHGHSGSFALQHIGTMEQGSYKLSVAVVPGSGAGELAGIAGTLTITITNGKHFYSFEYTLPATAQ